MSFIKRFLLLWMVSAGSAWAQSSGVVFTWTGNGNPVLPACSATVTTSCLTTFTLTDITSLVSPVVISSTIPEGATTYTESPLPSGGSHTWSLVINGKDQSGNGISSPAITTTLTVPSLSLAAPTGFTGTP